MVLVKIFTSPNLVLQAKACAILAEISIGHGEAKDKILKEIGVPRLVSLLKSPHFDIRYEATRILINITNNRPSVQNEALGCNVVSQILAIARAEADQPQPQPQTQNRNQNQNQNQTQNQTQVVHSPTCLRLNGVMLLGNLLQLLGAAAGDDGSNGGGDEARRWAEEASDVLAKEGVCGWVVPLLGLNDEDVQEQALRAIGLMAVKRAVGLDLLNAGVLDAVLPFTASSNLRLKRSALIAIATLIKNCLIKRGSTVTGAEKAMKVLESTTAATSEGVDADVQRMVKDALDTFASA